MSPASETSGCSTWRFFRGRRAAGFEMYTVLPEICTLYSEAPIAVARMHSPAGSRIPSARRQQRIRQAAPVETLADGPAQPAAEVAEVALLATVDVFGDAP